MIYFVLLMERVPASLEEELASLLFEYGAEGVSEDLSFEQTLHQFQPRVVEGETKSLKAYFTEAPSEELKSRLSQAPYNISPQGSSDGALWSILKEESKDWLHEWKKGYTSFELTPGFWIVPRWESVPPDAKVSFRIEPGMAFGTGTHETTQLVAEHMALLSPAGKFLDVGTGTGLLAYLALRQGYSHVVGIDNDPEAVRVATENLEFNGAAGVEVTARPLEQFVDEFDVVAANIIQSVLVHLRAGLVRAVRPGGLLIVSGVLKEHEADFKAEFFSDGEFNILRRSEKGDWVGFTAQRRDTP